jgi:hypothetical protein
MIVLETRPVRDWVDVFVIETSPTRRAAIAEALVLRLLFVLKYQEPNDWRYDTLEVAWAKPDATSDD